MLYLIIIIGMSVKNSHHKSFYNNLFSIILDEFITLSRQWYFEEVEHKISRVTGSLVEGKLLCKFKDCFGVAANAYHGRVKVLAFPVKVYYPPYRSYNVYLNSYHIYKRKALVGMNIHQSMKYLEWPIFILFYELEIVQ